MAETRFVLTMLPDGRAVLSTRERLAPEQLEMATRAFDRWKEAQDPGVLIVPECTMEYADEIVLDLDV